MYTKVECYKKKNLGFSIWIYLFGFSRCNGLIINHLKAATVSDRKVHKLAKKWQHVCIFLLCKKTMYQNFGKILDRSKNSVNYKSRPILDESGFHR